MSLEVDFGIGEHGALVVTDGHAGAVIAHLPQGARIGLNEALIIQAEWDAVRNNRDNTPLSPGRVQTILNVRCGA